MKVATIVYHKNISTLYKREWIEKSFKSILNQSFDDFVIYELNYGSDDFKLYKEYPNNKEYHFYKQEMNNHAEAMNFLIDKCLKDGFDVVFNNNLDDFNHIDRFKIQINQIEMGNDLVSSNFIHIDENDVEIRKMNFSDANIIKEFNRGNNIICHPSVCYSRSFLEKNRYISTEIPEEDFLLWKRNINSFKFFICSEYLINYRIHSNQVTKTNETKSNNSNINKVEVINYFPHNNIINNERCICGELKNKIKYNFCQKCNKLY